MSERVEPAETDLATVEALKAAGFQGFVPIKDLQAQECAQVPAVPGVYLVLRPDATGPQWLPRSTGGHFKERDPSVKNLDEIQRAWVDGATVLYIGKAGTDKGKASLRSRLHAYMRFGKGQAVSHWGGRFIWQLGTSGQLLVAWRATVASQEPRDVERALIERFKARHSGRRPFANLRD